MTFASRWGAALRLQRPSLAILASQELGGLVIVGDAAGPGVVLDASADAVGDVAQQHGLGQGAAVVEVAGAGAAGADGLEPLAMVAQRRGNRLLWRRHVAELLLGQQPVLAVVGDQATFLAFEENAVGVVLVDHFA